MCMQAMFGELPGAPGTLEAGNASSSYAPVDWRKAAKEQFPGVLPAPAAQGWGQAIRQRAAAGLAALSQRDLVLSWAAQPLLARLAPGGESQRLSALALSLML